MPLPHTVYIIASRFPTSLKKPIPQCFMKDPSPNNILFLITDRVNHQGIMFGRAVHLGDWLPSLLSLSVSCWNWLRLFSHGFYLMWNSKCIDLNFHEKYSVNGCGHVAGLGHFKHKWILNLQITPAKRPC